MYATQQHMVDRFGLAEIVQLTDVAEPATGGVVTSVLNRALEDADAEINGYLAARYVLPLSATPTLVVGLACDIARYRLYSDAVTETVEKRYKAAVRMLENIASGKISLGLDSSNAPAPVSDAVQFGTSTRVFGRDVEAITGDDDDQ